VHGSSGFLIRNHMPSSKDIRLDSTVAIVTGAARGLGKAMAVGLANAGASVMLVDRDQAALTQTVRDAVNQGGKVAAFQCDITDRAQCERAISDTLSRFGVLHVLVNNAGIGPRQLEEAPNTKSLKFWEADPDVWRETIVTNVNGTFLMARNAAPHLIGTGWGRIVNVTTSLPTMQRRANSPYGVSKAAIEAETLIWAKDLEGTGVTVNSLIPGGAADTYFVHMSSRRELAAMGRTLLPPSVMVAPIIWLASRLSDGVTGARFVGKLWDENVHVEEAARVSREAPVLVTPPPTPVEMTGPRLPHCSGNPVQVYS
jgi:NAD(P)-dependent dehydrogenase (short-subunit alcohol dehydrogenase family)